MDTEKRLKRWYDSDPQVFEAISLIKQLPPIEQDALARSIINFINVLRKSKDSIEIEETISIGKNRVLGLYKASLGKRWHDKNTTLTSALKMMATLSNQDATKVAEGIIQTVANLQQND